MRRIPSSSACGVCGPLHIWLLRKLSWQRICVQCRRPPVGSWVGKIPWRRDRLPTPVFLGFPCGSAGKETACNAGDLGLIPGLGRSPGEGNGYPLQYSGLENSLGSQRVGHHRLTSLHVHGQHLQDSCLKKLSNTWIVSLRKIRGFLHLGIVHSTLS